MKQIIQKLVQNKDLNELEAKQALTQILSGKATPAQTAAFLTALKMKGETVEELIAFATVMRENCQKINPKVQGRLVDTCGTGGDNSQTFNVSTISAFVIAGAGVSVAKHGNRAITSKCGSADILESVGVKLDIEPKMVEGIIEKVGVGFMFAPRFHPAMKNAALARQEIGFRTVFNLLGPLTNPAGANAQVLGVYNRKLTEPLACALDKLGCKQAMVVNGHDGLDEISTIGKTTITQLVDHKVSKTEVSPKTFGLKPAKLCDLQAATVEESTKIMVEILTGKITDARRDIVLVNSAAGLIVGGKVNEFCLGIKMAKEIIESDAASEKLVSLIVASGGNLEKVEALGVLL